jgi:hypothetical protein
MYVHQLTIGTIGTPFCAGLLTCSYIVFKSCCVAGAYSSAWNHSCWSPSAGPTLTRILPGTMSSPQFHCYIYGLRLEMKVLYYYAQYRGPDSCSTYIAHLALLHLQVCFGLHSSEFYFSVKVCWSGEGTIQLFNVSFFNFLFFWLILLLGTVTFFLFHSCTKCLFGCLYLWWLCFKM